MNDARSGFWPVTACIPEAVQVVLLFISITVKVDE